MSNFFKVIGRECEAFDLLETHKKDFVASVFCSASFISHVIFRIAGRNPLVIVNLSIGDSLEIQNNSGTMGEAVLCKFSPMKARSVLMSAVDLMVLSPQDNKPH